MNDKEKCNKIRIDFKNFAKEMKLIWEVMKHNFWKNQTKDWDSKMHRKMPSHERFLEI